MFQKEKIYKLTGKLMHYSWGGYTFLPELLGIDNPSQQPFAEYWMGIHPLGSAELQTPAGNVLLDEWIKREPVFLLSQKVLEKFGELPFLFKVQDVKDILSIQVHPSKEEAEKGFEREETEGVPRNAPHRNYKDRNHKPEMLVALSSFWLLHGFRNKDEIAALLEEIPEFTILFPLFRKEGLPAVFRLVMEMNQLEINSLLRPLIKREIRRKADGLLTKEMPGWWVAGLYQSGSEIQDIDRAFFSIYLLNIVLLHPGEALFQGAGMPHAYLEGQCVELMANSDNVLRGGLTPKHIDVPELMKHISFESVIPQVLKGMPGRNAETVFPCPVQDFGIARIELAPGILYEARSSSLEIIIVIEGGVVVDSTLTLKRGEAVAIFADADYTIASSGHSVLFKAFVPV